MTIKERRAAELAAKTAETSAKAKEAALNAVEPKDIVATMDEVKHNTARTYRNENGNARGTNGGKYYQIPVSANGVNTTVAGETLEGALAAKERFERGIIGDGFLHQGLTIGGMFCDVIGKTEEELNADIWEAEKYAKAHGANIIRDIDVAEQLVEAGYVKEKLEQVDNDYGTFLISYEGSYVMDLSGNTLVTLDNITSNLNRADKKTLLLERLNAYLEENYSYDDDDDYDDEDEYCYDDYDDEDEYYDGYYGKEELDEEY